MSPVGGFVSIKPSSQLTAGGEGGFVGVRPSVLPDEAGVFIRTKPSHKMCFLYVSQQAAVIAGEPFKGIEGGLVI